MEDRKEMNQEKVSLVKNVVSFVKKVNFFQILMLLVIVVVAFFAYKYKGELIVATVNGKPITRIELMKELEKQGAKQALDSIIVQRLIAEKAKNENIEISNEDVATEIKNIKEMLTAQGLELEQALTAQGMTMETLITQIKLQKELEKMVSGDINITDEQITEYITANAESLASITNEDEKKAAAKKTLISQQSSSLIGPFIEKLKTDAKINYLKSY